MHPEDRERVKIVEHEMDCEVESLRDEGSSSPILEWCLANPYRAALVVRDADLVVRALREND